MTNEDTTEEARTPGQELPWHKDEIAAGSCLYQNEHGAVGYVEGVGSNPGIKRVIKVYGLGSADIRDRIAAALAAPRADSAERTAGEELPKLSAEARQGVWAVEELKNHGASASDQFVSYGIDCGGHTILDTLNSGGGFLEQEPADDDAGPFIWDEQAKRDLTFVAALVNAYRDGDVIPASAAPAPSSPGVPDSVREKVARLINPTAFFTGPKAFGIPSEDGPRWKRTLVYGGRLSAYEKADAVLALISAHSAGQSTGLECTGCGSRESIESIRARGFMSCCPERKMEPAPDSTRTGQEETEEAWEALQQIKSTGRTTRFRANSEQDWKNAVVRMEREAETALAARPEAPSDAGWSFDMEAAPRDGTPINVGRDNGCGWDLLVVWWSKSASEYPWHTEGGGEYPEHRFDCWAALTPPSDPAPSGQAGG